MPGPIAAKHLLLSFARPSCAACHSLQASQHYMTSLRMLLPQLLKQGASVLALACAMDLRATLERAGNISKQRHVRGLVQEVGNGLKPEGECRIMWVLLS